MASQGLAINFNDEALWDSNFSTAVSQAKSLGVTAVRVWLGFEGYGDRPNAYDPPAPFGSKFHDGFPDQNDAEQAMARIFDLKDAGFKVLVSVNDSTGSVPTSADQVRNFYRHLMDAPEVRGGTRTLKDAVDFWEVGNEPDSGGYWTPSASNKTAGLRSYVDKLLIPAAAELHQDGETVVSGGVSYDPNDLGTILIELKNKGSLSSIDYAGFHPYGTNTVGGSSQVVDRANSAVSKAAAVGKKVLATEWNVRGYGTGGSTDAAWVKSMNDAWTRAIKPNFDYAFYFTLINNYKGRSDSQSSARPGGLLKHTYTGTVVKTSSVSTLKAYYESPMVTAGSYYTTFKSWGSGTTTGGGTGGGTTGTTGVVSGVITGAGTAAASLPSIRAYIDADNDGTFDATEPNAFVDGAGIYSISYASGAIPDGTYTIRITVPSALTVVTGSVSRALTVATATTDADFTVKPTPGNTPSGLATISGKVFPQTNNIDVAARAVAWKVFIDTDKDGKLDAGEKFVTATGDMMAFSFTGLLAGTYRLAVLPVTGWTVVTPAAKYFTITLTSSQTKTGQNFVVKKA